jgi:actin-like ATPase involved in cell morphogenesis
MKTIGVDLGTTNSCVYYLDAEDNPVLVTDRLGRKIYPSVVWCAGPGKEIVVGHTAKSRVGQQPPPILTVKRKIGTTETVELGGRQVSPVVVSAQILTFLKSLVEETTGDAVGAAVVTVPAYFDAAPKKDTYRAAVEAFFGGDAAQAKGRLELQLEPEAAAFAYTLEDPAEHLRILAYDLGGGTFDVTVLEKSPAAGLSVLKFGGDPHLGGDNVDDRIAAWMLYLLRGGKPEALDRILDFSRYPAEVQYTVLQQLLVNDTAALRGELRPEDRELLVDASPRYVLALDAANPMDLSRIQKLKSLAEKAKMDLTIATEATLAHQGVFADDEGNLVDIDLTLNRATFNRLIGDLVSGTLEETSRVLVASGLAPTEIDRIILVGGSTRMPIIREELEKRFPCPVLMADPDLIVARGAALKARQLSPPAVGSAGAALQLEYPRKTPDARIQIKGLVARPASGSRAYLSREGAELGEAPIEDDRFLFERVPLLPNQTNSFHVEVADAEDNLFAEIDFTIVHDERAVNAGLLELKLTKPIIAQGMRGFQILLSEGEPLPAYSNTKCFRGTRENSIVISFFEGERWLTNLVITGVDPSLPEGAVIDLRVTVDKDYTSNAVATVRETGQSAMVEFEILQIKIPTVEELDRQLADALEQFENDIHGVSDRDRRAGFSRRVRKIEAEYRKAKGELVPDKHHLYSLVGELQKLLIEVRGAHNALTPPREEFEELLGVSHKLAGRLEGGGTMTQEGVVEKVAALRRSGGDAWERQDAELWGSVNAQLRKLQEDLSRALQAPPQDPRQLPPEMLQGDLLAWIGDLEGKLDDEGLSARFGAELEDIERAIRQVDLRSRENARNALLTLAVQRLKPLDTKIARAIREKGGKTAADGSTGANVYF